MDCVARFAVTFALFASATTPVVGADEFEAQRRALIGEIDALARETARETGRPAFDPRVMAALARFRAIASSPPPKYATPTRIVRCRSGMGRRSRSRTSSRS